MSLFSERYGYTKPSDVFIRERITPEIQNAICNCYDSLYNRIGQQVEIYLWKYFLNERQDAYNSYCDVAKNYIEGKKNFWYRKLDLIEFTIKYLYGIYSYQRMIDTFVENLNSEFKRLNFAYRIINKEIVEITSEEEINTIQNALSNSKDNIKMHLSKALELYAQRPIPDSQNSIKESISAVEAYCREKTGENTLGKSLKKLEDSGIIIPNNLRTAFEKLYVYTNDPAVGIRHALMEKSDNCTPTEEEAYFMLVSCSTFINYLQRKYD
jgi:conserved hypothetical protein